MKTGGYLPKFVIMVSGLLFMACMLPGMIPLNREAAAPLPIMEKNPDKVIEALNSNNYVRLETLAQERYTEEDLSKPGTLTYTVKLADSQPVYLSYGWCTTTEEILAQNSEHIKVKLSMHGEALGTDVVHPLTFTRTDGLVCLDYGVLMSAWPAGEYTLEAVATFDEKINDGIADYEAGDYAFEYNVTVEEGANPSQSTSPSP